MEMILDSVLVITHIPVDLNTPCHSFQRDPITSGNLLVYERGMLGDHRKHKENFKKYYFQPSK
jgi:hypothetical protein